MQKIIVEGKGYLKWILYNWIGTRGTRAPAGGLEAFAAEQKAK